MRIRSKLYRVSGCGILSVTITLGASAALTQAPAKPEHKFPTQDNPRIVISNAYSISIGTSDRNEVSVAAEVSGASIQVNEVRIKPEKNKLEINCVPQSPDRHIYLTLSVPAKSALEIRRGDNKVEVKQPDGQIRIVALPNAIQISVPESSSLDMRDAPNAYEHKQIGQGSARIGIGRRQLPGTGPTDVKVTAEQALVIVGRGIAATPPVAASRRNPTIASTTIARRTGSMSKALRRSHPELVRPQRGQPSEANPTGESDENAVKLETHLVNLNVSATDKDGKAVAGLAKEDFSIYEDGVLQQISFFSPEKSPFNLVLLIDLSGSMKDEIELIKETALHFLDAVSVQDSIAVVTFTNDVTVVSQLTKDRDDLRDSINWMLAPAGGTSFYDALGYALVETLRKVKGQRNAVIAITDGEDNSLQHTVMDKLRPNILLQGPVGGSFLKFEELLDGATESDALIYSIHLNPFQPQAVMRSNMNPAPRIQSSVNQVQTELTQLATKQLRSLSDVTGARFYHANKIGDLKGVFEQVAAELRTVYSMAYTPTNQKYDGSFRKIRVQVNSADISVRTRPGYYGR